MPPPLAAPRLSFRELVFSDFARHRSARSASWLRVLALCTTTPGMIASLVIRAQQCASRSGRMRFASIMRTVGTVLVGVDVGPGASFGTGLLIAHPVGLVIGNGLVAGNDLTLAGGVTAAARFYDDDSGPQQYPTIGDGAVIGAHAVLIGGVHIGRNAVVGANSVVLADVPDDAIVAGAPARRVGTRETPSESR